MDLFDDCYFHDMVSKRLHGIMGLHTIAYIYSGGSTAYDFCSWICSWMTDRWNGFSIGEYWEKATWDIQPSDTWGAYLSPEWPGTPGHSQLELDFLPGFGDYTGDVDSPTAIIYKNWQC